MHASKTCPYICLIELAAQSQTIGGTDGATEALGDEDEGVNGCKQHIPIDTDFLYR